MADILKTGLSGLLAFQRALSTTSNNVANANTEGYSRQRVELNTRPPEGFGFGFVGTGVDVSTIRRIVDQFSINQLRTANSSFGQLDTFNSFAGQVDDILGNSSTGIANGLQEFFNAWQDVANDPSSVPARQLLIAQAESLAQNFRTTDQRFNDLELDVNNRVTSAVSQINSLATSIAKLNGDIVSSSAGLHQPPNDLLDQRDTLINQLASLTNITVLDDPDGAVNIFVGNGQGLVLRSQALELGVQRNDFDPSRLDVTYESPSGTQVITDSVGSGGTLGGLLSVRSQLLDTARNSLGQVATGLALAVNAQHREGMNLQGTLGGDLFALNAPQALADTGNTGTGSVAVSISNVNALTAEDYFLRYNGTAYSLIRASDGQTVTMAGAGTVGSPFTADGLSIVVSGTPAAGDSFLLRPVRLGAATLQAAISDPRAIAAAAPIRTAVGASNVGTATISAGEVLNAGNASLLNAVTIQFVTATTYSINGGAPIAYTSGGNIDFNGWRVQISGTPVAGDTFTVGSNAGGSGDNRNALLVAQLQSGGVLGNGTVSIADTFGALVGNIATQANQASINRDAQAAIVSQVKESVLATSGVNLDEEAAELLRWQQAYQASAQTISVANSIFQTLIGVLQR